MGKPSHYQALKLYLVEHIRFRPHDPFHIYIGFFSLLLTAEIFKVRYSNAIVLLPGFIISLIMEAFDLHDDYVSLGYCRWGASIHGLVVTNFLPVIFFLIVRYRRTRI